MSVWKALITVSSCAETQLVATSAAAYLHSPSPPTMLHVPQVSSLIPRPSVRKVSGEGRVLRVWERD